MVRRNTEVETYPLWDSQLVKITEKRGDVPTYFTEHEQTELE